MWRSDPAGPQGPMQVSEKAAVDVGGGNRFDIAQNRAIGRAYLALLHRRYGNWPDAISAYNWGLGRLDLWIRAGRPADKLVSGVAKYVHRVLHDSGLGAFGRNLAKAETLAAQFGREAGYVR
jgi:Transglycosylase SLT domain